MKPEAHRPLQDSARKRLPLRGNQTTSVAARPAKQKILASHLIWTGYAHWLSNAIRGSGSEETRKEELEELGPIHLRRKPLQPSKKELREFHDSAAPLLEHEVIWFDERMREVLARAFAAAARKFRYTVYAFAIPRNHAHAVVRSHRDRSEMIWMNLARAMGDALRSSGLVAASHPVWSHRPYKVFLYFHEEVRGRIKYVEENPEKERLPRQRWDFVAPYSR
jgi:hypothetical protein